MGGGERETRRAALSVPGLGLLTIAFNYQKQIPEVHHELPQRASAMHFVGNVREERGGGEREGTFSGMLMLNTEKIHSTLCQPFCQSVCDSDMLMLNM